MAASALPSLARVGQRLRDADGREWRVRGLMPIATTEGASSFAIRLDMRRPAGSGETVVMSSHDFAVLSRDALPLGAAAD